ncbi:unknown protein [Seminavis robusta]|uniref:Uncharacterized protein n=1 Tax=Seminavis robusta TaxID=568900 RepID=A0A9N8EJL0_9STRA|nr:unknown protein [Seminavis robusta]|eukprot:Sro1205_g252270.1 n/a (516) ;mRNA; r:16760-18391
MDDDLFVELSPDAIRSADEALAAFLASCKDSDQKEDKLQLDSPITMFIKGEYESPTGVMTSPMKYCRFDTSTKKLSKETSDKKAPAGMDAAKAEFGDDVATKRKLTPTKKQQPVPFSKGTKSPPLKRSSVPAGDGQYVQNGTFAIGRNRPKKPIPADAVILTVDTDSDDEKDRKVPAVNKEVHIKKEPKEEKKVQHHGKKIIVDANNKTTVTGGYEDWQVRAIKKERAQVYKDFVLKSPSPPPDSCSFLDVARLQQSGRTVKSAAVVSKVVGSVQTAASAAYPGAKPATKNPSSATAGPATAKHAPIRVPRNRRVSKKRSDMDIALSSSSSESEDSSDDGFMDDLEEAEKEKLESMGPYFRAVYLKELKESRNLEEQAEKLKSKFVRYSKAPVYNSSKENVVPKNYLARKKKEWKKKEADAHERHLLAKEEEKKVVEEEKKKNKNNKKKKGRSKSLGPSLKLGELPQFWTSESMFHARSIGNPGAKGVHSTLVDGGITTPDYRIPALRLKSSDRC